MASLQWGCRYGMLLPTSCGRKSILSTYVSSLKCFKVLGRLIVVQNRLYSKSAICCEREVHRKKRNRFTVLKTLASTVDNLPQHLVFDDFLINPRNTQKQVFDAMESGARTADSFLQQYTHKLPLRHPVPAWDADQLSNKLENKNGRTFEVYILGLLNCGKTVMAFQIYNKLMAKENICGSLHFYNTLLSHVCDAVDGDKERWNLALDIVGGIVQCNIKPDVMTFNSFMAIALKQEKGSGQICRELLSEMKSLNITPSLGSCYSILRSEWDNKKWKSLWCYFCDILEELKRGNVNFEGKYPLDLLFFNLAMDLVRSIPVKNYTLATDLLDFIMKNQLEHLLKNKNKFFSDFICTLMKNQLDVDFVFEQYRQYVPQHCKLDSSTYKELFLYMSAKKDPKYIPALYADYRLFQILHYEDNVHTFFSAMKHNVPKERREEFLSIAEDVYHRQVKATEKTEEMMTVMIYLMCSCGKHVEVKEKLDDCEATGITSDKIMLSVFKLALMENSLDVASNVLKVMSLHDLELTDEFRQCTRQFSKTNHIAVSINESNMTLNTPLSLRDAISLHLSNSND